jgi:hypothetical protein
MKILDLEHLEAQFGLMIREKENANNYALIRFEDLDKIIEFYNLHKKECSVKKSIRGKSK